MSVIVPRLCWAEMKLPMDHASLAVGISDMLSQWKARILAGFLQVLISNFLPPLGNGG